MELTRGQTKELLMGIEQTFLLFENKTFNCDKVHSQDQTLLL